MSLKTGEHATLTSKDQVEALLKAKFTGVPEHWIPDIAEQVLKEQPSPAGEWCGPSAGARADLQLEWPAVIALSCKPLHS